MEKTEKKQHFRDMTQGPEWKCILMFALPIMLSQFLQQLYSTVDGIVVGNYGSAGGLAAIGNCAIIGNVFISIAVGMGNGSGILVSQLFGAKKHEDMRRAASTAIFILTVLGVFCALLVFAGAELIVRGIMGVDDSAVADCAIDYLRIYAVGLIFTFIYNIVAAILRSVGDSRAVLYFLLVSALLNIALDLVFVAALKMDVVGAAWATVISQFACALVSIWYMYHNYEFFRFKLREIRPRSAEVRLCLRMALPSTLQQLVVSCGYLLLQRLINSFGTITMSAWTVGHRYDQYCAIPVLGTMQACASFAGQNSGANRYDRVRRGLFSGVLMSLAMVIVLGTILYLFAEPLSALFGLSGEALSEAVECLHFLPFAYLIFAVYIPFNGTYQGCGKPGISAISSLLALFLRVSASYTLVYLFAASYAVVWQTYVLGWGASLIFVLIYYFRGNWRSGRIVKDEPAPEQDSGG
ncbi:MAG: MATE family efflux transporter [Oscillospiraceae bacterium]|nr:MATE family efflux transporter [Oscillospiraceae bacterium]